MRKVYRKHYDEIKLFTRHVLGLYIREVIKPAGERDELKAAMLWDLVQKGQEASKVFRTQETEIILMDDAQFDFVRKACSYLQKFPELGSTPITHPVETRLAI